MQRLKHRLRSRAVKTVNNVLTVLNVMLKTAAEWEIIDRMPCSIRLLPVPRSSAVFHDFDAYEHLLETGRTIDVRTHLIVLLGGDAGLRCGDMLALEWSDVDLTKRQLCVRRSDWEGHVQPDGNPLTRKIVQSWMRRLSRRGGIESAGVHVLRHTFCSHLAMRGEPARAIQELAGHADLSTIQRYMHLSPAAIEGAIRLLDTGRPVSSFGDMLETGRD